MLRNLSDDEVATTAAHDDTVRRVRDELMNRLRDAVGAGSRVALLDFPNHPNVGDTAIYLGELAALRALDCDVTHVATAASYQPTVLRRRLGRNGTVLLHGGGNFGDIWTSFQRFREHVIEGQRDRRVVLLPQTIHYRELAAAAASAEVFARHPDLHLLLRDRPSLDFAQEHFPTATSELCPDSAFALGALRGPPPSHDLLLFARTDKEAAHAWPAVLPPGTLRTDWPEPTAALRALRQLSRVVAFPLKRMGVVADPLEDPLRRLYTALAHRRMTDGLNALASGRVTITDRLHGHILSLLLERPHVLLDNSYGKNRAFHAAWTAQSPLVQWAESGAEALALATAQR